MNKSFSNTGEKLLQVIINTTEGTLLSVFYNETRTLVVYDEGVPVLQLLMADWEMPSEDVLFSELYRIALEWAGLASGSSDILNVFGLATPMSAPEPGEVINPCCADGHHHSDEAAA